LKRIKKENHVFRIDQFESKKINISN